jgi:hypothetical protein
VLVVEVDHIGAQPLQRRLGDGLDVLGTAVDTGHAIRAGAFLQNPEAEFGGDRYLVAHRLQRLSEQDLVLVGAIDFRRVEEIDADLDGTMQGGDRVGFRLAAIDEAHAHAAEADGIDVQFSS